MKIHLILLLTEDIDVEEQLAEAARETGGGVLQAKHIDDAIQIVCARGHQIDLAIVDFDAGCHGMTLLTAIDMLSPDLPIVVITSTDTDHVAALAYANGAAACLAKPVNATELEIMIRALGEHMDLALYSHNTRPQSSMLMGHNPPV
jgi:DNA-binding NtrC family response regulator